MRLRVRDGKTPGARWTAAVERGVRAMGDPDVEVVAAADFDGAVRELTGSSTYTSDRGTGTVGARTLTTAGGSVIVVNTRVLGTGDLKLVERTLAHEAGHVLIDSRGEVLAGRHRLVDVEWQWLLMCLGGYAMHEARIELAVAALGYPGTGSATGEHVAEVLHATDVDHLNLLEDPAADDPRVLADGMTVQLDRLSKVLAYAAADTLHTGSGPAIAEEGQLAEDAWDEYVAPSWERRLELYRRLPPATVAMPDEEWDRALLEGLALEHDLLRSLGFEYETGPAGGYGFYRRVSNARLDARDRRARAQAVRYGGRDQ